MHSSCILYEENLDFQYEFKLKAHQKFLKNQRWKQTKEAVVLLGPCLGL